MFRGRARMLVSLSQPTLKVGYQVIGQIGDAGNLCQRDGSYRFAISACSAMLISCNCAAVRSPEREQALMRNIDVAIQTAGETRMRYMAPSRYSRRRVNRE